MALITPHTPPQKQVALTIKYTAAPIKPNPYTVLQV